MSYQTPRRYSGDSLHVLCDTQSLGACVPSAITPKMESCSGSGDVLRQACSSCPDLAITSRLRAPGHGLGWVQESSSASLEPQRPLSFQGIFIFFLESMILKKRQLFVSCPSCSWEEVCIPNSFSFSPFSSVPKIQISFSLQRRDHLQLVILCWSLCILQHIFAYIAEFWGVFSGKRSVVEKEDIFHVETILKVLRDMSGLWCSRKISQLKSVKGCASKLIACFCP